MECRAASYADTQMAQQAKDYLGQIEDEGVREAFEERAAILEYVVGLTRERAERMAFCEVIEKYGSCVREHFVARRV